MAVVDQLLSDPVLDRLPSVRRLLKLRQRYSALSLEACGFAKRGEGFKLAQNGDISLEGPIPICTMGGLKARGNPVGATGVYQVVEVVEQLRGQAGKKQVEGARVGLHQNGGGFRHCDGGCSIVSILKK